MKKSLTISALSALVLATSSFAGAPSSPPAIGSQIEDYDIFDKAKQVKLSTVVVIENLEKSTSDEDRLAGFDKGNGKDVTQTKKISVTVNDLLEQSGIEGAAKLYEAECNLVVTDANGKVLRDPSGAFASLHCGPEISADKESIKTDSKDRYNLSEKGTETENVTLEFVLAPVTTGEEGKVNYTFEQTSIELDARVITKSKGKSAGVIVRSGDGEIYRDVVDFNKYSSSSKSNALIGDFNVEKYKMVLDGTQLVEEPSMYDDDRYETYGVVAKGKLSAKAKNKANASDAVVANTVALYEGQVVVLAALDAYNTAETALEAAEAALAADNTDQTLIDAVEAAQVAFDAAEIALNVEGRGYLFSDAILALYPLFNAEDRANIELNEAEETAEETAIALGTAETALEAAEAALAADNTDQTLIDAVEAAQAAVDTAQQEDDDAKAAVKAAEDKSDAAFAAASPDLDAALTALGTAQTALGTAETALAADNTNQTLIDAVEAAETALEAAEEVVEVAEGVDEQNRRDYSEETLFLF